VDDDQDRRCPRLHQILNVLIEVVLDVKVLRLAAPTAHTNLCYSAVMAS
jgi:hypothetical protein